MILYRGRARLDGAARQWLPVVLVLVMAVVLAIGIELSLLYPYLNR